MNGKYLWNDGWSFLKTEVGTSYSQVIERIQEFEPVALPHDWLIYDTMKLYEDGTGWYRKSFVYELNSDKKAFITFEGVYMDSAVYINGAKAGEWKYGYSAFTLDITDFLMQGENEILVSACFMSPNSRWYSGAGIYRDVWFKVTDKTYLPENAVYVSTKRQGGESFLLRIEAEIAGDKRDGAELDFRLFDENGDEVKLEPAGEMKSESVHGASPKESDKIESEAVYGVKSKGADIVRLSAADAALSESEDEAVCFGSIENTYTMDGRGSSVVIRNYQVKDVKLWNTVSPTLYTLRTQLLINNDEVIWQEEEKIGFRYIEYNSQKGFFLNGRHMKLNGVCEHHDLGALGAAFNKSAMRRKFRILKEMGVNAVRGAHNMMASGAIGLADEMGILILSEAFDMWERPKTTYDYARFFKEWSARDVESWIKRERNHPSVIMWSIGNEIYDTHADAHGQEITAYLKEQVEKYDPMKNAAVTLCSNYMQWENTRKCADMLKMAGYNYGEKNYEEHHKAHPDWVIYGSETSSIVQSRGVYHFPLNTGILAEEDGQCSALGNSTTSWSAKSMEICAAYDRDLEFSLGQFIWSGFDYIGEPTPYSSKNSYFGQIDTAGFPKDSYYVWQSAWTDYRQKPMIHIFPYWDFNEGQLIDVRVCSNAPYVELFINGRSLGRQRLTHEAGSGSHIIADYRLPYEKGTLTAIAYDYDEKKVAEDERHSFGNSDGLVITADDVRVKADGRDLLFLTISTADSEGRPVENACDRVRVQVTGAGRLIGLDNGDSTDFDSYKGVSRRLFNGKLLAIVQADNYPGEIRIEVTGKGLKGASLVCESYKNNEACENNIKYENCGAYENDRIADKSGGNAAALEYNKNVPILLGNAEEIPVRRITLKSLGGQRFTKERDTITVEAYVEPPQADDKEIIFRAVNDTGVPTNLVSLEQNGNSAVMKAKGDGSFRLCAVSKSGTDNVRIMSQLEFSIDGFGQAYMNPYEFISGSLYSSVAKGEVGCGNERGVANGSDGETVICYSGIDFGSVGSDEITIPIFTLNDEEYPIQIWEGVPGEQGSSLLADVIYCKPHIWNVYQPETYKLNKKLKGITAISLRVFHRFHIKGFSFTEYKKAWQKLKAVEADAIYGDSFVRSDTVVEGIGNNVSLEYTEMDFGERDIHGVAIKGRARNGSNTIHICFYNGMDEIRQIVEFPESEEYILKEFELEPVNGRWNVSFVFLPGSNFDFEYFRFM